MFGKGDKIVYPMYGAGIVEDLEEKQIDGVTELYYVLNIPVSNLKIMVSASKATTLGIRPVHTKEEVIRAITGADHPDETEVKNWNQRYKDNLEKIKSGKLSEVTVVFKNLLNREKLRSLSSAEKKMLTTAKQIIISEIAISQNIEKNEAEEILFGAVSSDVNVPSVPPGEAH